MKTINKKNKIVKILDNFKKGKISKKETIAEIYLIMDTLVNFAIITALKTK